MAEGLEPVRPVESLKEMGQFNLEKRRLRLILLMHLKAFLILRVIEYWNFHPLRYSKLGYKTLSNLCFSCFCFQ